MNIKRMLKPTPLLGAGLVVGMLALSLSFWGCDSFSSTPMSATPSTNQTTEGVTVELGTDAYRGVTLRRGGQQIVISPPAKVIWSKMAVGQSANTAYLLAHDEISHWTYNPRSLVRLSLPKSVEPLSSCVVAEVLGRSALSNLVGDAFVVEMDGVSRDGKRLLLRLGLKDQTNTSGYPSYFTRKTYYYYPAENRLDEISP